MRAITVGTLVLRGGGCTRQVFLFRKQARQMRWSRRLCATSTEKSRSRSTSSTCTVAHPAPCCAARRPKWSTKAGGLWVAHFAIHPPMRSDSGAQSRTPDFLECGVGDSAQEVFSWGSFACAPCILVVRCSAGLQWAGLSAAGASVPGVSTAG